MRALHPTDVVLSIAVALLAATAAASCTSRPAGPIGDVPLIPVVLVTQAGGIVPFRAPIRIRDAQLQMVEYDAAGKLSLRSYDEVVFPIDLMITYSEDTQQALVFLRRSPHGGCLLLWNNLANRLDDPCLGSKFDLTGQHISGPSRRNLDQLPANVRDGIIWVTPEVVYGALHP